MSLKEFDILDKDTLKTAVFTLIKTLGDVLKKHLKDHPLENRVTGIVYKVKYNSCSFVYNGESKMLWNFEKESSLITNKSHHFYYY